MQIQIHWSHFTFDRVTQEALLHVNICYWVNMALQITCIRPATTGSPFAAAAYRASALCSGSTLISTQTHTHTYKSQKWGLVAPRPGKDTRGHRSQRPWSNANWVSIFDWGLPPIVWCNHSDRYHFAMRFLIVVSGGLSKTIKDQNALNNAPLSLSKLSRCYKGAGLLTLLIFIMALKAHVPLWWRIVYLKAAVHRHRYVFKRLFVVLLHMPWGNTKAVLRTVMG